MEEKAILTDKPAGIFRPRNIMLGFLLVLGLFRLTCIGNIPLTPDEAYYWTWSRDLAPCYYDQPGMTAWVNRLFGLPWDEPSPFSVRLPAVLLGFFGSIIMYLAYRVLYQDELEASVFIIAVSFLPLAFMGGFIFIHDTVLSFFLILSYIFMFRIVRLGKRRDWYFLALAVAGALYSKFSAVMPGACFALFILLSPNHRKWLKRPEPYIAFLIAAVLFLPAILWNHEHDWISLHAVKRLQKSGGYNFAEAFSSALRYIGTQLAGYSPLVWLSTIATMVEAARRWWRDRRETELLLLCLSLPIILYFFAQSFRTSVFGNWSAVGYIPALMLLSHYTAQAVRGKWKAGIWFQKGYMIAGVALAAFMSIALTAHVRYGVFRPVFERIEERQNLQRRIDWRLDNEFFAWDKLVILVETARPGTDFILTRRYQVASILEFYMPDHPRVLFMGGGRRGSQFELWSDFTGLEGMDALFVDISPMPAVLRAKCGRLVGIFDPFRLEEGGRLRKEFFIYECRNFTEHPHF